MEEICRILRPGGIMLCAYCREDAEYSHEITTPAERICRYGQEKPEDIDAFRVFDREDWEKNFEPYFHTRFFKADDRATMLNLMVGLGGYTLCSGIICEDLNGSDYCAVKLDSDEIMTIGYIARKGVNISALGKKYLEEISRYKDKALK